ncbi:MAG: hypothetical protein JWM31_1766 [Solirubrobacterales bacterium]|nr:hypothetical protein [Solirubrobacterales bacterium]
MRPAERNSGPARASSHPMPRPAHLLSLLTLALLGAVALLPAARADAKASPSLAIGIADQKVDMFRDPRLRGELHVRKVRRVVPWDAMNVDFERAEIDPWMAAAKAAGERVLVSFGHSRRDGQRRVAPTPAQYVSAFRRFRARYPEVTEFAVWNEPNVCGEPLCHKPQLAARYYDALSAACPSCTILAAEVLDNAGMALWVKGFLKAVKQRPKVWGLHNYLDANRLRTSGTRRLLALVKGQIWFTETGGIVKRRTTVKERGFPETVAHAGVAVRWIFDRLVPLSPRITRVYLYHWDPGGPLDSWDSALLNLDGTARTGYRVVLAQVERRERARGVGAARRR